MDHSKKRRENLEQYGIYFRKIVNKYSCGFFKLTISLLIIFYVCFIIVKVLKSLYNK